MRLSLYVIDNSKLTVYGTFGAMSSPPQLPVDFLSRIAGQLGDQTDRFVEALSDPTVTSVLMNPLKSGQAALPIESVVPWNKYGHFLQSRPEFVFDPVFHAGGYYVMEPASMLMFEALNSIEFDSPHPVIIDLCAAPGGKSMVALNYLQGNGVLVSNEVNRKRFGILNENVAKWGHGNTITINLDPSRIFLDGKCDCVIVDAPCSGEGLFRKTPKSIGEWSMSNAAHCSLRQRRILGEAMRLIKPDGYLIYSTCTYNPEENIENVAWIKSQMNGRSLDLRNIHETDSIESNGVTGYQSWPHRMPGEGFFLAILQKGNAGDTEKPVSSHGKSAALSLMKASDTDAWGTLTDLSDSTLWADNRNGAHLLPIKTADLLLETAAKLNAFKVGTFAGVIKGTDIVPSHELALSKHLSMEVRRVELDLDNALRYLRRETLPLMPLSPGWHLASYNGFNLGWIKQAGKQTKNYFPIDWRIRKQQS